jgi:hypothetical protein
VAEKGLMAPASARAIRAAVSQILKIDDNWESVDVRIIDVEALFARFRNLSKIAPGSLAAYESRFRSGLQSYLAYLDNPTSYQPKTRKPAQRDEKTTPKSKGKPTAGSQVANPSSVNPVPTQAVPRNLSSIHFRFALTSSPNLSYQPTSQSMKPCG